MWKIAVGFAVFAAISLFVIMQAGDKVDMTGNCQWGVPRMLGLLSERKTP
jgi:hypothetical protein